MPDASLAERSTDDLDLTRLSRGERLLVWRRRFRLSQLDAAHHHGLRERAQQLWSDLENDRRHVVGIASSLRPTTTDLIIIARRRSGLDTFETSRAMGISRIWWDRLEKRGDKRIVDFWKTRGFKF